MSQSADLTLSNQSGANFRTELNSILGAVGSLHSGSSRPSYVLAGMMWLDTAATPWVLKLYDGSDDISLGTVNASTNRAAMTIGAGGVVDRAYAEYTANANLTTTIPADDTPPLSTEGTQILSVTITPKRTTNILRCRFQGFGGSAFAGTDLITVALFNGTTLLQASGNASLNAGVTNLLLEVEFVPATTSPVTLNLRVGGANGTVRMNGTATARRFGGAARSTLVVEEIVA